MTTFLTDFFAHCHCNSSHHHFSLLKVRKACQPGTGWTLILALAFERHNKLSPWRAYIDSLPDPTSPVTWGPASVGQFQSPTLSESVVGLQEYIREK